MAVQNLTKYSYSKASSYNHHGRVFCGAQAMKKWGASFFNATEYEVFAVVDLE